MVQLSVEVFELYYFPDEEVSISVGHFRICDVDHVVINVEVQLKINTRFELLYNISKIINFIKVSMYYL